MSLRALMSLVIVLLLPGCTERALDLLGGAARDLAVAGSPTGLIAVDLGYPVPTCATVSVSTLAGNGNNGFFDGTGGPSGTTELGFSTSVAVDSAGTVVVADWGNNRIREVAPSGSTTTLAGNGKQGFFDGTGGRNGTTMFYGPTSVAVDPLSGAIIVSDVYQDSNRLRRVDPSTGATTTLAGSGPCTFTDGTGGANGTATFCLPFGVAVDSIGYTYVADYGNRRIRKIAPDGTTTTLSGNGQRGSVDGTGGPQGTASFLDPNYLALDPSGNVFVSEFGTNEDDEGRTFIEVSAIRRVAPNGDTTTVLDGLAFTPNWTVRGIAVDPAGWLYVATDYRIYVVLPDGTASPIAGGASDGVSDDPGCTARFKLATGIALSGRTLFVADALAHRIRKIELP